MGPSGSTCNLPINGGQCGSAVAYCCQPPSSTSLLSCSSNNGVYSANCGSNGAAYRWASTLKSIVIMIMIIIIMAIDYVSHDWCASLTCFSAAYTPCSDIFPLPASLYSSLLHTHPAVIYSATMSGRHPPAMLSAPGGSSWPYRACWPLSWDSCCLCCLHCNQGTRRQIIEASFDHLTFDWIAEMGQSFYRWQWGVSRHLSTHHILGTWPLQLQLVFCPEWVIIASARTQVLLFIIRSVEIEDIIVSVPCFGPLEYLRPPRAAICWNRLVSVKC